jgi:TIR domain
MADVFISYSRKDKDFVRRLDESLKSRGREAWVDWEDIRPTEEWMQAVYAAIEGADAFVFVLTPDSVASVVCGREIAHAAAHNKRMVPIAARDVNAETVPEALAKLQWILFRQGDDFEKATDMLISALDTDLKWVHAHTRMLARAIEWESKGKSPLYALRGDDLRSAERWLADAGAQKDRQPTALQIEFVVASRKAEAGRQQLFDTDLKWVQEYTRLLALAIEWEDKGKNNSLALRGDDLRDVVQWLAQAGTSGEGGAIRYSAGEERCPTALQFEYITASLKAATRRQRITLGAVTFGFVIAVVLAVVALFACH